MTEEEHEPTNAEVMAAVAVLIDGVMELTTKVDGLQSQVSGVVGQVAGVIEQVAPAVEKLAENPVLRKLIGGGKRVRPAEPAT
ncbi:hypothetical protein Aph01nite_76660 [Acrocarpospora phusangensis]|uniref:Uncharacterized protein n=1 Tax=Acrocarpospora phusangensis TaxID=1070424 RepID=A0A919UP83_9ACTN|nr:hypothetical protein [Acrocarpospora phusangensis]GIH29356.1 hypothetical protein Aph01nite_76660 [Acrocarpospora phusangensis]